MIPELRENYGSVFSSAVLVRDPLPRLASQLALFQTLPDTDTWDLSYVNEIAARCGRDPDKLTREEQLKLHGFNMLNSITEEKEVGPIFRIEDLTRNPESMSSLVNDLTSGRLLCPGWWLDYVRKLPPLNGHCSHNPSNELSPADLLLLSRVVTAEAKELYRNLGYGVAW